jgi:[acyl-carrier-protein] S-malonyltransferase
MPVFLFPGQGAQYTGMGIDLYDADADGSRGVRALFDLASKIRGIDIRDLLNADADTLKRTDASQVAITVASLAAVRTLASRGITPSACAGFSLGEYPALAVAGVISDADAISLTIERGRIMQAVADKIAASASESGAPGMAAVLGLAPERVDEVVETVNQTIERSPNGGKGLFGTRHLFAANYNSPLQTVISGSAEALALAETAFKEAGARRVVRLKVAGPFHSPLMHEAGTEFSKVLEDVSFADPRIPLFSNVTGKRVQNGAEAKKCAVAHISNPVRWTSEEAEIANFIGAPSGGTIPELLEVGPGRVLSGLWADSRLAGVCKPYAEI